MNNFMASIIVAVGVYHTTSFVIDKTADVVEYIGTQIKKRRAKKVAKKIIVKFVDEILDEF